MNCKCTDAYSKRFVNAIHSSLENVPNVLVELISSFDFRNYTSSQLGDLEVTFTTESQDVITQNLTGLYWVHDGIVRFHLSNYSESNFFVVDLKHPITIKNMVQTLIFDKKKPQEFKIIAKDRYLALQWTKNDVRLESPRCKGNNTDALPLYVQDLSIVFSLQNNDIFRMAHKKANLEKVENKFIREQTIYQQELQEAQQIYPEV